MSDMFYITCIFFHGALDALVQRRSSTAGKGLRSPTHQGSPHHSFNYDATTTTVLIMDNGS